MTTKLTLTIDDSVINSAKKYAREQGKSLSDVVESYLKIVTDSKENTDVFSPRVAKLMGSVKVPANFDYEQELEKALIEKYK